MSKKKDLILWIIMSLFLVFYIWVAAQIPYTHDDWDWGLEEGIHYLLSANINARYVGNFIVVLLTRSVLLKTLVMGVTFWLIPICMTKLVSGHVRASVLPIYLLCNMFPALLQHYVMVQTYNWVSGFANYVLSGLLLLVHLLLIKEPITGNNSSKHLSKWKLFFLFVFSVVIQLFLENVAVFMVVLSVITLMYAVRQKKCVAKYVTILAGNITGLFIMFSSSMYSSLVNTGSSLNGIRELAFKKGDGISAIIIILKNIYSSWIPYMVGLNFKFYFVIAVLMAYLVIKYRKNHSKRTNFIFVSSFPVLFLILLATADWGISFVVFTVIIFFGFFIYIENKALKIQCIVMYIAHFAVIAPLVILDFENTSPHRLFMTSNVFLMLLIMLIVNNELLGISKKTYRVLLLLISAVILCGISYYWNIYFQIGRVSKEYKQNIEAAIEKDLDMISFPIDEHYNTYLWGPYPCGEKRENYFKRFYGLNETVDLNIDIDRVLKNK